MRLIRRMQHSLFEVFLCAIYAAKLVPVGFGIKKLQITAVIEDSKIESMDAIIEEELVKCAYSHPEVHFAVVCIFQRLQSFLGYTLKFYQS